MAVQNACGEPFGTSVHPGSHLALWLLMIKENNERDVLSMIRTYSCAQVHAHILTLTTTPVTETLSQFLELELTIF